MTQSRGLFTFAGGFPSPGGDFEEERLDLAHLLSPRPEATYFMRVYGRTWEKEGIFHGDILVVDRSREAHPPQVVLATCDNRFVLCRLAPEGVEMCRKEESRHFQVWGVVTFAIHPVEGRK